jgi:hypothetical protein
MLKKTLEELKSTNEFTIRNRHYLILFYDRQDNYNYLEEINVLSFQQSYQLLVAFS